MRYLIFVLVCLALTACGGSRKAAKELLPPAPEATAKQKPDGSATARPAVELVSLPPDASEEELKKAYALALVREAETITQSAAASAQVKIIKQRLETARQERYQDWLMYIGMLSLLGIAACVGLYVWAPIGKKTIIAIGCSFAAMVVIAFTFSAIVPYLIYVAWAGIGGLILFMLFVVFKQDKAGQGLAKVGERALSALPKKLADEIKFEAAKEHIKTGIADAVSGTLTKVKKKFTGK